MSCMHFASSPSSSSRQLPLQQLQHDLRTRVLIFVRCFGVILSNMDFRLLSVFRAEKSRRNEPTAETCPIFCFRRGVSHPLCIFNGGNCEKRQGISNTVKIKVATIEKPLKTAGLFDIIKETYVRELLLRQNYLKIF